MKGQVMADFVLEYSRRPSQHDESSKKEWWTLRVDGASRSSGSGVGLLLQSPTGEHLEQAIRLGFSASNNEAEYEAICPDWTSPLLYPSPNSGSIATHNSWPWPFAQWGMDIVGPLPAAPAQKKFLLVATDYFSKWVEAEAYASIKDKDVTKKGLNKPKENGSRSCPASYGPTELHTGRPTGNTPFALAYGMDAVIPTEIGLPTIRTDAAKQSDANMELGRNLDWTDEVRESAAIRMADYQQRASAHYNRKVRPRSFKNGTLVLRKVFENTTEVGAGKFQANWEGPYIVSKASTMEPIIYKS
ncbi:hypothetical protein CK203_068763 [Vitis vinifera]|uniref:Integrase catalytic domain-containing protein n=1 Tax=Vitis vinifera TaxID=29760 RepID=A0A438EY73_VITVI|nr:hypothetical protein CK203_068763 [Vitis vinifera]